MNISKKGVSYPLVVVVVALILVIGGVFYFKNQPADDGALPSENNGATVEEENITGYSGSILAGDSALLLDFKKADYDKALQTDKLIVLYFYANWCPICRAEFPKMQEAFNELNSEQVIGFRVNFNDNETDADEKALASEFGVAYQHTKVFVKNGQRVGKSPESWDKDRYLSEINKSLTE